MRKILLAPEKMSSLPFLIPFKALTPVLDKLVQIRCKIQCQISSNEDSQSLKSTFQNRYTNKVIRIHYKTRTEAVEVESHKKETYFHFNFSQKTQMTEMAK
jgi:hypothetical protein